jgi:hypothetical protein
MTEKAKASGNALDKPTSVWSEMARKYAEPIPPEKANDDRRQSVDASQSCCLKGAAAYFGCIPVLPSGLASGFLVRQAAGRLAIGGWPYEGLSRMKGNFQVRFLEGGGLATARLYSAKP